LPAIHVQPFAAIGHWARTARRPRRHLIADALDGHAFAELDRGGFEFKGKPGADEQAVKVLTKRRAAVYRRVSGRHQDSVVCPHVKHTTRVRRVHRSHELCGRSAYRCEIGLDVAHVHRAIPA
jgi:hypothetical protein